MIHGFTLLLGVLFGAVAMGGTLPTAPEQCQEDISLKNYCTEMVAGTFSGPIELRFFLSVEKSAYGSVEEALNQYLNFEQWPAFAEQAEATNIVYRSSVTLPSIFDEVNKRDVFRHYADFKIAAPIVQWQEVRSVTHNYWVEPYEGALASIEFVVQNEGSQDVPPGADPLEGAIGIRSQTGYFHGVDCATTNKLCPEDSYLIVYDSIVEPDLDILPKISGGAIQAVIEKLMLGMYLR